MENPPVQIASDQVTTPDQTQQSQQGSNIIATAGGAVADYGGRHSSDFKIFFRKWFLWLINFFRFVFMEFFKEIFNRG